MKAIARYLAGAVIANAAAIALTLVSSLLICLGLHPESAYTTEIAAPVLGLICAGAWLGLRAQRPWMAGAVVGLLNVVWWFGVYLYLMGRWNAQWWVGDALPALDSTHLFWWTITIAAGALGGVIGGHMRRPMLVWAAAPLILASAMSCSSFVWSRGYHLTTGGVSLETRAPDREGTVIRLVTVDLDSDPDLRIGLYDADSDDSSALDDTNTSYLGRPVDRVRQKMKRRVVCAFNAGFFGWSPELVGAHVAPIVVDGRQLYDIPMRPDWWTFGISSRDGLHLVRGATRGSLPRRFRTAITLVRPLIVNGKPLELKPGAGVTRLRCSRCSIAWKRNPRQLLVLNVRDPDGEMASVRQWKSGERQTGGWDLVEIRRFWQRMGVENAIALDGGDSTQMTYLDGGRGYPVVRSGYHLSRTLGYLNRRPIRLFIPGLPAYQAHNGVMNYLYVYSK